jgi:YspA, cpYpsA-related SLOG family
MQINLKSFYGGCKLLVIAIPRQYVGDMDSSRTYGVSMIILICGDRMWDDLETMVREMERLPRSATIVHGAAKGADTMAGVIAEQLGMTVVPFPADWKKHGRSAGPVRNREMFRKTDPDLILAFHSNIEQSKGTKDMVNYARQHGCPTKIVSN